MWKIFRLLTIDWETNTCNTAIKSIIIFNTCKALKTYNRNVEILLEKWTKQ